MIYYYVIQYDINSMWYNLIKYDYIVQINLVQSVEMQREKHMGLSESKVYVSQKLEARGGERKLKVIRIWK